MKFKIPEYGDEKKRVIFCLLPVADSTYIYWLCWVEVTWVYDKILLSNRSIEYSGVWRVKEIREINNSN
jgi:hypothetical protein